MIGHMILRKNIDGEDILGLKVIGGRTLPNGRRGAIIDKVKRGSIADQEGHIKPGNHLSLFNFSFIYLLLSSTYLYFFLKIC